MGRYFLEVTYRGTAFSGFQVQENARTVQGELERAIAMIQRVPVTLTGSSRTDAGVHAVQNFFHFDFEGTLHPQLQYKLNAVLDRDVAVRGIWAMEPEAHARFGARERVYEYRIYRERNPFLQGLATYYPYKLDLERMQEAAELILGQEDFFPFAKTGAQVKSYRCRLSESRWEERGELLVYRIAGNRFLRGMVRLLTATQLKVGRGYLEVAGVEALFRERKKCGFSVPAEGLYLMEVRYPQNFFPHGHSVSRQRG